MSRAKKTRKAKMKRRRPFGRSKREHKICMLQILTITLALILSGCYASLKHTDKDGNVTQYVRIGNQTIGTGSIDLPCGGKLTFTEQESKMPPIRVTLPNGIIIESGGKEVVR